MEVRLKERLFGNGLYNMIKRALLKPVIIESPVIASDRAVDYMAFPEPLELHRHEAYRKSMLEVELIQAQAIAEASREAFLYF
jgi:hypothetical protein